MAYNQFCSDHGGIPLLNQTPLMTRAQLEKGLGDRWKQFAAARQTFDPTNRLLNDYFRDLLGLSGSSELEINMLSTPWEQRKNTVRLRDHRVGLRRRHLGGAGWRRPISIRSPRSAFWSAARNASPASFRKRWPA